MNRRSHEAGQTAISPVRAERRPPTSLLGPTEFLHCAIFSARAHDALLGEETFRLVGFEGQEGISEPYEFNLELHADTDADSGKKRLRFDDVIGRGVTVGIQCPSVYSRDALALRFQRAVRGAEHGEELSVFNGIVTSFAMEIPGVYRLGMRPALWKLSLTNQYKIHRQMTICEAISNLLQQHRIDHTMTAVSGADNLALVRSQDWLQAGESDLEFIQRLMGKAHLSYYFKHSATGHTLVFVNQPGYVFPSVLADNRALRYAYTLTDDLGMVQDDTIAQYSFQSALTPSSVRTVFTRQEAAWERDPVAQLTSFSAASQAVPGELPFNQYKIYQYGCSKAEVTHFSDVTAHALKTSAHRFSGSSRCAHFRTAHQFSVSGAPPGVRPSLQGQAFVLTSVKHKASADGTYQNEFESIQADGCLHPFSLQETNQGTVLARVVARPGSPASAAGNEVVSAQNWRHYTRGYFDPETGQLTDTTATPETLDAIGVYVRFSTDPEDSPPVWVKLAPHMQTVPELGVSVTVARAQDESELPEIQSIVQANGGTVIMPSRWTANTNVGSSYSTSYGDGQSIRYGLASKTPLAQAVTIVDGAYRSGNYRETSYAQGASYSFSRADKEAGQGTDNGELFGDYAAVDDLLSASESFGSTFSRQQATVTSNVSRVGTSYAKSTIGDSINHSTITGTSYSDTTHGGDITSNTTIHANSTTTSTQTGNVRSTTAVTGDSSTTTTYTGKVSNDTTHHGDVSSKTTIDGDTTNYTSQHDVDSQTYTNNQSSLSATLSSRSTDTVGISNRNSATGASFDTTVAASTNSISMVGASVSISLEGTGYHYQNSGENPGVEEIALRVTMIEVMQIYL